MYWCWSMGKSFAIEDRMQFKRIEALDNEALWPIACAGKNLTSGETHYRNIEREAIVILNGLKNFHHYHYTHEVIMITDHKPLVANFLEMCCKPIT